MAEIPGMDILDKADGRFVALSPDQRISAFCYLMGEISEALENGVTTGYDWRLPAMVKNALDYAEEVGRG